MADKKSESDGASSNAKSSEEEEFQIAADLTLYANPLRILTAGKKTSAQASSSQEKPSETNKEKQHGGKEIIAADLTKYGCPIDDK